jgi:sucrose phosphorylase
MGALLDRLRLRKAQAAFHPNATQFTVHTGDDRILGLWRQSLDRRQSIFALHNVSPETVTVPVSVLNLIEDEVWVDLLVGDPIQDDDIVLAPYQCRWISNSA